MALCHYCEWTKERQIQESLCGLSLTNAGNGGCHLFISIGRASLRVSLCLWRVARGTA